MKDDDDKVKKLLDGRARRKGALSAKSLNALDVVDVGAQIQAGLGVTIDDVAASEVVLLTMMPDDSASIASAGNTDAVRDGHNFVLDALKRSKQSRRGARAHALPQRSRAVPVHRARSRRRDDEGELRSGSRHAAVRSNRASSSAP